MPEANNPDTELWILIGIVAAIILFGLLVGLCVFINDFSSELRYLNKANGWCRTQALYPPKTEIVVITNSVR